MNKSKITIEYNQDMKSERKLVKNKKTGRPEHKTVQPKNPKCWEVITVEKTTNWVPGQRLTKSQVDTICKLSMYDVQFGLPGQFRVTNSRY